MKNPQLIAGRVTFHIKFSSQQEAVFRQAEDETDRQAIYSELVHTPSSIYKQPSRTAAQSNIIIGIRRRGANQSRIETVGGVEGNSMEGKILTLRRR